MHNLGLGWIFWTDRSTGKWTLKAQVKALMKYKFDLVGIQEVR
jgi:hypothetical protein